MNYLNSVRGKTRRLGGLKDSGRQFWKELREVILSTGCKANKYMRALYSYEEKGDVKVMIATHVDDLLWAATPEGEVIMQKILDKFDVRKVEENSFRFCGKDIVQEDTYTIRITCRDSSEKCPYGF